MARHGIPTARYRVCESSASARARRSRPVNSVFPVVLKADGLAAGKGVVVGAGRGGSGGRDPRRDGRSAVRRRRGASGDRRVSGRAGSVVLRACATARARFRWPRRRITSVFSTMTADRIPAGWVRSRRARCSTRRCRRRSCATIVEPVLRGMRAEGTTYRGFLYCRADDDLRRPEGDRIQRPFRRSRGAGGDAAHRRRLRVPLLSAAADGDLRRRRVTLRPGVSVGVVLAAAGYPGAVTSGVADRGSRGGGACTRRHRVSCRHGTARRADRHRRWPRPYGGWHRRATIGAPSIAPTRPPA